MASLALSNESAVAVTLGAPGNGAGLFHVTNDLALDGQLSVTAGLGYGQGIYRLFDYDGTLTDGGLDIAAMPTGTTGPIPTRSEARRVGKAGVRSCRSRMAHFHEKKKVDEDNNVGHRIN